MRTGPSDRHTDTTASFALETKLRKYVCRPKHSVSAKVLPVLDCSFHTCQTPCSCTASGACKVWFGGAKSSAVILHVTWNASDHRTLLLIPTLASGTSHCTAVTGARPSQLPPQSSMECEKPWTASGASARVRAALYRIGASTSVKHSAHSNAIRDWRRSRSRQSARTCAATSSTNQRPAIAWFPSHCGQ